MTLNEIKAMFQPGQIWEGVRTPGFDGAAFMRTCRTIEKVQGKQFVARLPDGKRYWTTFPKAAEVLESRPGYLRFALPNKVAEVELTRKS